MAQSSKNDVLDRISRKAAVWVVVTILLVWAVLHLGVVTMAFSGKDPGILSPFIFSMKDLVLLVVGAGVALAFNENILTEEDE